MAHFIRACLEVALSADEAVSPVLGQLLSLALSVDSDKKDRSLEEELTKSERDSIRLQRSICAKQYSHLTRLAEVVPRLADGPGFEACFASNVCRVALHLFHSNICTLSDMAVRKIETSIGGLTRLNPNFFLEVALSSDLCALLVSLLEAQLKHYLSTYFEVAHLEIFLSPSKQTSAALKQLLQLLDSAALDPRLRDRPRFSLLLCTCETFKQRTSVKTSIIEVLVLSLLAQLKAEVASGPSEDSLELVKRLGFLLKLVVVFLDFQFDPAETFEGQRHPFSQVYTAMLHRFLTVAHQLVEAAGDNPVSKKHPLVSAVVELTADLVDSLATCISHLLDTDPDCLEDLAPQLSSRPDGRLDPKRRLCVTFSKQFLVLKHLAAANQPPGPANSRGFSQKPGFGFSINKKKHLTLGSEVIAEPLLQPEALQPAVSSSLSHLLTKDQLLAGQERPWFTPEAAQKYLTENGVFSEKEPSDRLHLNLEEMRRNFSAFVSRTKAELQDRHEQRSSNRSEENKLARQIRLNVALS